MSDGTSSAGTTVDLRWAGDRTFGRSALVLGGLVAALTAATLATRWVIFAGPALGCAFLLVFGAIRRVARPPEPRIMTVDERGIGFRSHVTAWSQLAAVGISVTPGAPATAEFFPADPSASPQLPEVTGDPPRADLPARRHGLILPPGGTAEDAFEEAVRAYAPQLWLGRFERG